MKEIEGEGDEFGKERFGHAGIHEHIDVAHRELTA